MIVFVVVPKLPGAGPRGTMAQRANVIRQCTAHVIKMNAQAQPLGAGESPVPYTLVRVPEIEVDVILPRGRVSTFALNSTRPYFVKEDQPAITEQDAQPRFARYPNELHSRAKQQEVVLASQFTSADPGVPTITPR